MLLEPAQALHIGNLSRPLRGAMKLRDPYERRARYHRAGVAVSPAEDRAAAALESRRRAADPAAGRAPSSGSPLRDSLIERMAEDLALAAALREVSLDEPHGVDRWLVRADRYGRDPTRREIVEPATRLAKVKLARYEARAKRRRHLARALDRAGEVTGFAVLIVGWAGAYCVVCPPARAATKTPLLADEHFSVFMSFAPAIIAALCVLAVCWRDRGRRAAHDEAEPEFAPETLPVSEAFLRTPARDADRTRGARP